MNKIWLILLPLVLILGFFLFKNLIAKGNQTFSLNSKTFSLIVPNGLKGNTTSNAYAFTNPDKDITFVGLTFKETKNTESPTCTQLKNTDAFSVKVSYFNETFTVCESSIPFKESEKTLTLDIFKEGYLYDIIISGKKDFLDTDEGKTEAGKIFGSFKVVK